MSFQGRKAFSLNYLFASFAGALMIAGAFAYYNYKFSQYNFVNFEEMVFYQKADIFTPKKDEYIVLVYSSHKDDVGKLLAKIKYDKSILAIDFYQQNRPKASENIIYVSSDINTLLGFVQRFNIYKLPCGFRIKKHNNKLYKQYSPVKQI